MEQKTIISRRPKWLRVRLPFGTNYAELKALMSEMSLHTVCESARCPNVGDCWNRRTATFMLLGDVCTRSCGFCAVRSGQPCELDETEPERIAEAVERLGLRYAVVTSVTRDDLPLGGAEMFAATIRAIRRRCPHGRVEVLIPDFLGNRRAIAEVAAARPDVLNHNLETVPRLYPLMRPQADYARSLALLRAVKELEPSLPTKSGIMVGVGETISEVKEVLQDLAQVGVDIVTIGQYLQPSMRHVPVARYYSPEEFQQMKQHGESLGILHVESGPLVRSSYHAHEQADALQPAGDVERVQEGVITSSNPS